MQTNPGNPQARSAEDSPDSFAWAPLAPTDKRKSQSR
jgi:hypothetical protein